MKFPIKFSSSGASTVELTIAIPLLAFFLFGFVEFALWYGTSAMVRQAAIEGLNFAATSSKITSSDEEEIEDLRDEVDAKAKEFAGMFLVNPEGTNSGVATLINDSGSGRAFELAIPSPGSGETLSTALLNNPLRINVSYTYRGVLYGTFRTLMGGDANSPIEVFTNGYAESATPPAKDNFYDPCGGGGGRGGGGPSSGGGGDPMACKYFCKDADHGCPSGNCTYAGGECIPCPPNTQRSDNGQCTCALPGCSPGSPIYQPNEDCTACICDAVKLQADCDKKKGRLPNGSSCFGGPIDTVNCTCTPGSRCAPGTCTAWSPQRVPCTCDPALKAACEAQGDPWFWDAWPCECRNCSDNNGTVQNGSCACDTSNCQLPATAIWWDEKCKCKCAAWKGLEVDSEAEEDKGGGVTCKCRAGFTQVPDATEGFKCECQITCPTGTKKAETNNGECKCICDTGITEMILGTEVCVLAPCAEFNCPNRHNEHYTGGTPNVLDDCDCGSSG